ncbi:unnamed protein product [Symbiodinium microadriaticum]|nr:unnamed protein product [Symbiodinium microadriaticum]
MAVNPSTPGAPADPVLQQGMSPSSTFVIEGESQGPDYGRTTLESLRTPLTEPGMRGAAQLPIGAVTATTVDGGAGTLGQSAVQSVEAAVAADDVQPCQLPRGHGTMVAEPSVRREDTGPVATMANFSGPGRDETLQGGSLFPQYMPSPLPGQSPVASQTGTTTRAAAWLSRLGDYLQRTVEVTSWTTHGSPNHAAQLPLQNVLPGQGVSPELVQAEVARQLEAAMGEMQDRLRKERERSDEAVKEAQALRRQLDVHEMRAVLASRPLGSEGALVPPPGLADVVVILKRGLQYVQKTIMFKIGVIKGELVSYRESPSFWSFGIVTFAESAYQDLSDTSYAWWEGTLQDTLSWYTKYSAASPLERLQLKPSSSQELHHPEWARVERRATAMMLSAVPQAVREEVIAMGSVTSLALLCKLYAVYQPGNLQAKALVLQRLERPEECDTALQAVEALRKWTLWRRRASSIGIAEPDASVLVQGLDGITTKVVKANSELSFRVSLIRSTLQVDVCPSSQSVTTFLQHLQAEMEQQARLSVTKAPAPVSPGMRAVTPVDGTAATTTTPMAPPPPPPKGGNSGLCRFFQGEKGCRRGNTCKFPHTWSLLEKGARSKKCLACGATGHKVKECRAPGGGAARTSRSATSGMGETGSTSPTASSPEAQRKVNFEDDGVIQTKVLQMLNQVQHMPLFKALMEKVCGWISPKSTTRSTSRAALLDSGATHVLRAPKDEEEWTSARNVSVQLAGDSMAAMKQTSSGSLLTGDQLAQVIVPLGKVICTLGYKLSWTSQVCELIGPDGSTLPLTLKNGCPEVSEKVAHKLIKELEDEQLPQLNSTMQSSIKMLQTMKTSWWSYLLEYVKKGDVNEACMALDRAPFFDFKEMLKERLLTRLPKEGIWELLKDLRVNRRARKRLLRASAWILRWDPPAVERPYEAAKHLAFVGDMVYVNVNRLLFENEFPEVWRVLQWAAFQERPGTIVSRDAPAKPLEQVAAGPHRCMVHFVHALSTAARELQGGGGTHLYVEDLAGNYDMNHYQTKYGDNLWPPWTLCKDSIAYYEEMGLSEVSIERFAGDCVLREQCSWAPASDYDVLQAAPEGAGVDLDDVSKEEEQWKKLLATFKEPIATSTLYFAIPVNNKKAATMLPAVQRIAADVKALGYPITRIHSDRGGEFRGNLVRRWALSQGMWPTTTSGSDSAANGVAESGVRYLKRRARILLDSAGLDKANWPTAVQYAAAQQRCDQLGVVPVMPVAYGTKVYVKTKKYKTGAVEDFGHHWTRGRYVGPSTDIRGGHVILKDSGTFIQTMHVRVTRDPPSLEEVAPTVLVEPEEDLVSRDGDPPLPPPLLPPPKRRVRIKSPHISKVDGFAADYEVLYDAPQDPDAFEGEEVELKYLRVGEIQYMEAVAQQLYSEDKFQEEHVARLLALVAGTCGNLKVPRAPGGKGMVLGCYVHGGSFGITRYGRDLPWVQRYFNYYLATKIEKNWPDQEFSWTTLAIQSAEEIPKHKDSHNERGTCNYVMELKTEPLEGLWVQDGDGERKVVGGDNPADFQYEDMDGRTYDGCLLDVTSTPAMFDPLVPHAYVRGGGTKWFLSGYTPQGAYKLCTNDKKYLVHLGFPLARPCEDDRGGALETTPVLKAVPFPSGTPLSGTHGEDDEVGAVTTPDCETTLWEWAIYAETPPPDEQDDEWPCRSVCLKKLCSSDDPGPELEALTKVPDILAEEEYDPLLQRDMEVNVEHWTSMGLYDFPKVAKLEPEYVEGIETIVEQALTSEVPLRHTYNVSPAEAKAVIEKWRPAITKELGVVERGFKKVTAAEVMALKEKFTVQELPSKLVYTVKPPAGDAGQQGEAVFCRRKARIVCCGNYAAEDQGDLFAGGAAA